MFQMLSSHSLVDLQNEIFQFYPFLTGSSSLSEQEIRSYLATSLEVSETAITSKTGDSPFSLLESAFAERLSSNGKRRWGVKDPHLTYALHEFITRYPTAKFLFMIRDPRAVVSSYLSRKFNVANSYYGAMLWTKEVELQRSFRESYPDNALLVRYEDLLTEKEQVLREVCNFLEIPLEHSMLNYFQNPALTRIHSGTENITKDVDPSMQQKWKKNLSQKQIRIIDALTAVESQKNGYCIEPNDWQCKWFMKHVYALHQWLVTTYIWNQHKIKKLARGSQGN